MNHTGEPTWSRTRVGRRPGHVAVGAVPRLGGVRAAEGPGSTRRQDVIEVAVDRDRHIARPAGVTMHRSAHLEERVQWHLGPPRVRYHDAVLDQFGRLRSDRAGRVGRAGARRSVASHDARAEMPWTPSGRAAPSRRRGRWMAEVAARPWPLVTCFGPRARLPPRRRGERTDSCPARRQVRDRIGSHVIYRDVEYHVGLVVELRRLRSTTPRLLARELDMDRDLLTTPSCSARTASAWGGDQVWGLAVLDRRLRGVAPHRPWRTW